MAKTKSTAKTAKVSARSTLTQRDAKEYRVALKEFSASASTSKESAQRVLQKLGTHTKTGKVTKRYGG